MRISQLSGPLGLAPVQCLERLPQQGLVLPGGHRRVRRLLPTATKEGRHQKQHDDAGGERADDETPFTGVQQGLLLLFLFLRRDDLHLASGLRIGDIPLSVAFCHLRIGGKLFPRDQGAVRWRLFVILDRRFPRDRFRDGCRSGPARRRAILEHQVHITEVEFVAVGQNRFLGLFAVQPDPITTTQILHPDFISRHRAAHVTTRDPL